MSEALYDADGAANAPTTEELTVAVEARDVLEADREAWAALERYLAADPVTAWRLKEMKHSQNPERPGMLLSIAVFVRNPDVPTPSVPPVVSAENGETA